MAPIVKLDTTGWKARDFVYYFKTRYQAKFEKEYTITYQLDCTSINRIIDKLRIYGKPRETIVQLIDWFFNDYYNPAEHNEPLRVGFLWHCVENYLGLPIEKPKRKTKREPITHTPEVSDWIKQRRASYQNEVGTLLGFKQVK